MEDQAINNSNAKSELWNLSFRDLFYKYVRFLPLIVLSVSLTLLGAYLYLRYKVPIYNAVGSILIKNDKPVAGRGDKVDELMGTNSTQNIQTEIEILKSRPLMERVARALDLQFSYYAIGKIKTVNIYNQGPFLAKALQLTDSNHSVVFKKVKAVNENEFRFNDQPKTYRFDTPFSTPYGTFILYKKFSGQVPSTTFRIEWMPASSAAAYYASQIQVIPKAPGTGILNLSMLTPNQQLGADILNRLMKEYGAYTVEQKKLSSDQTLVFISDQIADIGKKLDSSKAIFLNYQKAHGIADPESQTKNYLDIIAQSDVTINDQITRQNFITSIDGYLADKKNEFSRVVVPSTLGIEDGTLNGLVDLYNKAQLQRKNLLDANVPSANPLVKETEGQVEKLRLSIRENLKNIQASNNNVLERVRQRGSKGQSQLQTMPEISSELDEMKKRVQLYEGLNKIFTEKQVETAISRASTVSNSEIINQASSSATPVKPKRRTIQIMAILLGFIIPALFIFISEVLNDKVSTRFDIEKITAAPILGEIGHSYSNNTLVVSKTTRSMVAEQFRIIRSNLQYVLSNKNKATILVTSSFSGEGKSYISTNIGAVLSLAGKKTIILEFDIRKPRVLSGLGMAKGPGISNFLVAKSNLPDLIKPVPEYENLFVLGCGPIPPNPSELLLTENVDRLFEWLRDNYDMIIIDTAPVGMVSDAMTLGKYAEATLYLVRQGHTFKKQVALIDEFYKDKKLPKVSIILNDVKLKPGYGYYGYGRYGYGYGYGYGSYYEEEVPPGNFFERLLDKLDFTKFFKKKKKK
jgi:tyrosine-protein kinase Etk/Wzc